VHHFRIRLLALALISLVAASCSSSSGDAPQAADTSTTTTAPATTTTDAPEGLAFADEPLTLRVSVPRLDFVAPHLVDETDAVQVLVTDLLTDGLTVRDTTSGFAAPGVADSWSTSDDGLVWTFLLGNATFGDGTPIEADDVVESLNRVARQGVRSISGPNLWAIEGWEAVGVQVAESADPDAESATQVTGIVAVDAKTVEITVSQRFEPLPEVLGGVTFGVWPTEEATGELPISSSIDFQPSELWTDGLRVELPEQVNGEISTIELFVDPTNSMLAAGETDVSVAVDPTEPLGKLRGATVQRSADAFFAMNATIAPFDDPMIRQAIVLATNRTELRDEYYPNAGLMQSFVPQQVPGGVADSCGERCEYDRSKAQQLVDASPSRDVEFTVDYFLAENGDDSDQRLAEAVVSQLRSIGLLATARSHTPEDYGVRAARGELGLFRFGSVSTVPTAEADLGAMFETAGRDNLTGTSIERFDELIAEARSEPDASARADLYEEAELVLFGEAVVLPLVEFRHHLAFGPTLQGVGLEPDGSLDLSQIEFAPPTE